MADSNEKILGNTKSVKKLDTHYSIKYSTGEEAYLYILNSHVFKYHMSPSGKFPEYPEPMQPEDIAKINIKRVSDYDSKSFDQSVIKENDNNYIIHVDKIDITFCKTKGTMKVHDKRSKKTVFKEVKPLSYTDNKALQTVFQHKDEYFFGGGMQNGRFTHKGEVINIVNSNNWIDGGVTSPCPFYWSTYGYGVLRNTWQPGIYDFKSQDIVKTTHKGEEFDVFYFVNPLPKDILNDYYELTGQPILLPEYAFYEAHLNAFNRDYWVKVDPDTTGAILFEDGLYYKCYQPNQMGDKKGILESLNGEKNNYQFSARAMIDRYKMHDMPLGWFVPNDGYGSGYGQTDSLEGDIENLKEFADYARKNGVEVALWTESNLHPEDPNYPKKGERDLSKEVGEAGVVALKCDVAWIGSGYSFGLTAVENAASIFVRETKHNYRPMIIMVDGWAGTQRYSGIWSGDQTGGEWEYIRFHIPTYIGSGLSGQPIIGSDMDGIYGGKNREVNIRDYQWKAFTPLQLNMDGWGRTPKTPFSFDDKATAINRAYLKLKSMLMPYNYTISHESTHGLPMIRAMFLEFPEEALAYTKASQYQFMWGPDILVAPIYNNKKIEDDSLRNDVYLPDPNQIWIDFFTGEKYQGGKILNNIMTPLWKIPVFVRDGAILAMTNPNNNPYEINRDKRIFTIYPNDKSTVEIYEDDGITSKYSEGHFATNEIIVHAPESNNQGDLFIAINETKGHYNTMVKLKRTLLQIMASQEVENIKMAINGESVQLSKVETDEEFAKKDNVYYFKNDFLINPYLEAIAYKDDLKQRFLLIKIQKIDVTKSNIEIKIKGYINKSKVFGNTTDINSNLKAPSDFIINKEETTSTSIKLQWKSIENIIYYEIEADGSIFTNILGTQHEFEGLKYNSEHSFRIRSVNENGISDWTNVLIGATKEDPYKNTVKGVKVACSLPCQPCQEVCQLTDGDPISLWHTHWGKPGVANKQQGRILKLNFDLSDVYELDKMEYIPREDAGNGTFLQIQYRTSIDGKNWSVITDPICWDHDAKAKSIFFYGIKLRFVEITVLDSIGGFGSGKQMLFYKSSI